MNIEELLEVAKQRGFEEGWKACENRKIEIPKAHKILAGKIIELICSHFSLPVDLVAARNRKRDIVIPRQITTYLLRKYTNITVKEIGKMFDQDHTTILHSVQVVNDLLFSDQLTRVHVEQLSSEIETYLENTGGIIKPVIKIKNQQ